MLGLGTVSLYQAEPDCVGSCQDSCYSDFYRLWGTSSAALVLVTAVAVKLVAQRPWIVVAIAAVIAAMFFVAMS